MLGGWDGVANMRFSSVEVLGTGFFVSFLVGLRNGGRWRWDVYVCVSVRVSV